MINIVINNVNHPKYKPQDLESQLNQYLPIMKTLTTLTIIAMIIIITLHRKQNKN